MKSVNVKIETKATIVKMEAKQQTQRMTSLEIAELTGKPHNDLMKAIRKMEPAWKKINGGNFSLVEYRDHKGEFRPCYSLTKTECLYIATKFNDEARAKLVLRWQALEMADVRRKMEEEKSEKRKVGRGMLLLGCSDEEILEEADDIIGEELQGLNRYANYCYSPTEIGKPFGLEGRDLNSFLCDSGIIQWANGQWMLTAKYRNKGLTETKSFIYHGDNGRRKIQNRLVWTEKGRDFILSLLR